MMANGFTIITDLGGVLVTVDKWRMSRELAKYSSLSAGKIFSNFSSTSLTRTDIAFGKGLVAPRQFYRQMLRKLRLSGLSFGKFAGIYSDIFRREEGSIRLLRQLGKRHTLALLSNTDALHYREWSRLLGKDLNLFKQVILSFRVHAAKPGRKIFLAAAMKLGVKPGECVYIDDRAEYARAAAKVGMLGIHFTSPKQLRQQLRKIGIIV